MLNNIVFNIYYHSDFLVKSIIITLLLISSVTWACFFSKYLFLMRSRRLLRCDLFVLKKAFNIEDIVSKFIIQDCLSSSPLLHLLGDVVIEFYVSLSRNDSVCTISSIYDRVVICLERRAANIVSVIERGILFFSTVALLAPFIGLFGTVLSIIKCFISFSDQVINFSLISSGISEALVLTGLGLFVAIPTIMIHSILLHCIIICEDMVDECVSSLILLFKRDLDLGVKVSDYIVVQAYQKYKKIKRSSKN